MSSTRWVALHCGEETDALQAKHPNAFLLLSQIVRRTRWKDCVITGMKTGQAFIGDWRAAGLRSEKAYQVAKKRLAACGLVAFEGQNKGTVATLCSSTVFSIQPPTKGEREDRPAADEGRTTGGASGGRGETIHTEHKEHPTTLTHTAGTGERARLDADLIQKIKSLRLSWSASPVLAPEERIHFNASRSAFELFTEEDWKVQREFLAARLPEGNPAFQPAKLSKYLSNPGETLGYAKDWKSKQRPPRSPGPPAPASTSKVLVSREVSGATLHPIKSAGSGPISTPVKMSQPDLRCDTGGRKPAETLSATA